MTDRGPAFAEEDPRDALRRGAPRRGRRGSAAGRLNAAPATVATARPGAGRSGRRGYDSDDFVSIDDQAFFIRYVAPIPVEGR